MKKEKSVVGGGITGGIETMETFLATVLFFPWELASTQGWPQAAKYHRRVCQRTLYFLCMPAIHQMTGAIGPSMDETCSSQLRPPPSWLDDKAFPSRWHLL